ncbi:alpha-amylase family glycosyl hydrolase [Ornithinimicrobium avium]|uniref:Alpha-amylase n=1 Tax=Ornithinimicrobium avium TaxID=2283195 RepID=A0A345NQ77_9MICO|nr:alpha-amylase family glycosyl hydrolase [Ornithinimicrobium avium]AXH97185.1 alpha-amylase [Ornithinimicrobium avium]
MTWAEHAIFWHVYPLGFTGAPQRAGQTPDAGGTPYPRLRQLVDWLDYAVGLGLNGLLLGPVFASVSHGYDTLDHERVDPRLGTQDDLAALAAACRERGVRLVLDGVFNHLSADHPLVRRAVAAGPGTDEGRWIRWVDGYPRWFEGHPGLVELDLAQPVVASRVAEVMTHWLDRGADGWRLDAAYAQGAQVWRPVLDQVRAAHPDAWVVGEVIHGDYAGFVRDSGVDTVTQYELWKATWSSLVDGNLYELDHALGRHAALLDTFVPQTFVGNHDVTRIASRVGKDGAVLALTMLMTVGGVPSVYYGDDQGFEGVKEEREGGDDAVRPSFPGTPGELASWGEPVSRAHVELVGLRRRHPWLVRARTEAVTLSNDHYVYRATGTPEEVLEVELDLRGGGHRARVRDGAGQAIWSWG